MKVIKTSDNIDFILPDENNVEFINDKALVKLVGLAKKDCFLNSKYKMNSKEFRDLMHSSFTDDEDIIHTLIRKYNNGERYGHSYFRFTTDIYVLYRREIYALIDRNFKECNLTIYDDDVFHKYFAFNAFKISQSSSGKIIERIRDNDYIIDDIATYHVKLDGNNVISYKYIDGKNINRTNLSNVLKCEREHQFQLYNLDTMEQSRKYDYIGDFEEFVKKDVTVYNACHAVKNITVKESVDGIDRIKSCTLDFYINEEGKVISPVTSSIDNDLLIGGESCFEEIVKQVTKKLSDSIKKRTEESFEKRFLMKRKNNNE